MSSTGDAVSAEATVTAQGRLAIPQKVREAAGFEAGVKVHLSVESDGVLRLETRTQKARRLRDTLAQQMDEDDTSLADELAEDRRAAAEQEGGG